MEASSSSEVRRVSPTQVRWPLTAPDADTGLTGGVIRRWVAWCVSPAGITSYFVLKLVQPACAQVTWPAITGQPRQRGRSEWRRKGVFVSWKTRQSYCKTRVDPVFLVWIEGIVKEDSTRTHPAPVFAAIVSPSSPSITLLYGAWEAVDGCTGQLSDSATETGAPKSPGLDDWTTGRLDAKKRRFLAALSPSQTQPRSWD